MEQSQEKMTDVIDEDAAADSVTVSIILVPKDEAAHEKKKLKRTPDSDSEAVETDKDKLVVLESSTLRKCSRYFATCMSGRWETETVFHLELQTEAGYYQDCFARMKSPFVKPIPTITHGIQLFKVASQIEYHALMDVCEKYLAAAPWSTAEEDDLRSLCALGYLSSYSDLVVRLRFPMTKKAKQVETQSLIQRTLSRYLKNALTLDLGAADQYGFDWECAKGLDFRDVFAETFRALCKESDNEMKHDVLAHAVNAMKKELVNILLSIESSTLESLGPRLEEHPRRAYDKMEKMEDGLFLFVWMFRLMREANAAHVAVELLMKHDISKFLQYVIYSEGSKLEVLGDRWARMIYCIFQDILGGRLFLKSSERMTLFMNWSWMLKNDDHRDSGGPPVPELVTSFLLSFPQLLQEEIFLKWDSDWNQNAPNLPKAHTMWLKSLVCSVSDVPNLDFSSCCN